MKLSQNDIEKIALSLTRSYLDGFYGSAEEWGRTRVRSMPIDCFAENFLRLEVYTARLSPDGSICGLTSYADTELEITEGGITRVLGLSANQVVLDSSLTRRGSASLEHRRRFTLAHECAHQILFRLENADEQANHAKKYAARAVYTPRELKTREDWNEWQANALGAAILMPRDETDRAMRIFNRGEPVIKYGKRFSRHGRLVLHHCSLSLGVSLSAAAIRLDQLGYVSHRPAEEYEDCLNLSADD